MKVPGSRPDGQALDHQFYCAAATAFPRIRIGASVHPSVKVV
jgi:hypothetical protein